MGAPVGSAGFLCPIHSGTVPCAGSHCTAGAQPAWSHLLLSLSFPNSCWGEPGMSQDSPWPWVLLRARGVPWAPHPWHPVPPIHVCTPSSPRCALGGMPTHPVCTMPGFGTREDGRGTVGTPRGCAWTRQRRGLAGAAPLRGVTWGHHLGTIGGIHLPAVALFPLLEEPSLSLSVPLVWGCWEPALPPQPAPAH